MATSAEEQIPLPLLHHHQVSVMPRREPGSPGQWWLILLSLGADIAQISFMDKYLFMDNACVSSFLFLYKSDLCTGPE
jgi:hypothetical protein